MDEHLDLRDLPPVPAVEPPARLSQTLLRYADRCPRSAYLYLRHRGGPGSHPMDRGSLFHAFAERMAMELVVRGEKTLYAPQAGEDGVAAAMEVASLTKIMVEELAAERPDLVVPAAEMDRVRTMAYHLAIGWDVDPEQIAGVERKFVLDLECGWTISGKVDLLHFLSPTVLSVDDYKTTIAVPTSEAFAESFQVKLYGLLAMFGQPVEKVGGEERRLEGFGAHLTHVRGREIYPRAKLHDGRLTQRENVYSRQQLADFRHDVERTALRIQRGLETGKWPAVPGGYCSECPSSLSCPLPKHLRRFAGAINTHAQAAEALAWALRTKDNVSATEAEIKAWVRANGPVRVGRTEYGFEVRHGTALRRRGRESDWTGLEEAVLETAHYGTPFAIDDWLRPTTSTVFKGREISADSEREDDENG